MTDVRERAATPTGRLLTRLSGGDEPIQPDDWFGYILAIEDEARADERMRLRAKVREHHDGSHAMDYPTPETCQWSVCYVARFLLDGDPEPDQ